MKSVTFQPELEVVLPIVKNNIDYQNLQKLLKRIDEILVNSGVESYFTAYYLAIKEQEKLTMFDKSLTQSQIDFFAVQSLQIIRCSVARALYQQSYVDFTCRLAESFLLQWFCKTSRVDVIRVPSKSQLQRFESRVPETVIKRLSDIILTASQDGQYNPLNLEDPFEQLDILLDPTCIESNIHFPVDWVLLRDGSRTILKAIRCIRKKELLHRITDPDILLSKLNQKAIAIGRCKGRDSKRKRKKAFRELKKFANVIRKHGQNYRKLLADNWEQTDLSERQTQLILSRLDNVITQLPEAIEQAHNRIIRGELTENKDKILSFYDDSTSVILRGKAGARIEFGCKLMLAEQTNGFIVDWQLYNGDADDVTLTEECVQRIVDRGLKVNSVTGDKGCDGPRSRRILVKYDIENRICARSVKRFQEQMSEEVFKKSQKRRARTEARIAIAKNNFIGNPIKNKEFLNKQKHTAWSILAHNLWLVGRLEVKQVVVEDAIEA